MAITTLNQLATAMQGRQILSVGKVTATGKGAGFWHSLWRVAGAPTAGATPATGAGTVPTDATAGALAFSNPTSGLLTYLSRLHARSVGQDVSLLLYDRLWSNSGLSGTTTTTQSFSATAITRNTGGVGNQIWLEVYTAFGATGTTFTVTYTNQAGTGSQTAVLAYTGGAPVAGQLIGPFPLAAGDTGVRSVQSVALTPSTGTAGDFGVTLMRPLTTVALGSNVGSDREWSQLDFPTIADDACLAGALLLSSATVPPLFADLSLVQG